MFNRLRKDGNKYSITSKREFECNTLLDENDIKACFSFAYDMTFGGKGEHRAVRSGGDWSREKRQIFTDTFQGKLAEYAFYNYFSKRCTISKPDMRTMGLKKWDGCDFVLNNKQVAIKSTKDFGQLLLLETKDWDSKGQYIPNYGTGHMKYDFFVMIRIRQDKKTAQLLQENTSKDDLLNALIGVKWQYNIAGYISHDELVDIIQNQFILPKNSLLGQNTKMDAENYYVQLGDMHKIKEMDDCLF